MADELITRQELIDAKPDVKNLGEAANGNETGIVTPRYGAPYSTAPAAIQKIESDGAAAIAKLENTGGFISAPTLAALQAISPEYDYQLARVDATGDEYRWNPALTTTVKWEATGRNFLSESKTYADSKANTAENNAKQFTTQYFVNLGLYSGKIPAEYDKNGIVLRYFDNSGNMIVSGDLYANGVKLAGLPKNVSYLSGLYPAQIASDNIMPMSFDKFGRLIAIPHPSFSKQVIEQTKSAVDTSSIVSSTNIVLFGDSITATGSGYGDAFMLEVQADRTVVNRGIGGQDTREIVQRQGGVPIPVAAFTMPASGSVSVTLTNGDCYYQKGGTYAATINDIAIIVAPTSTQNVWTVTRVNAGAATAIPAGSIIILEEQKTFRNHTLILQPGPNWNITTSVFTETQILQTIEYTAAAINYLAPKIKKFLIIGEYVTANYSQDISNYLNTILKYNALLREFSPANFFDIHKYGSTQAIYDAQKLGLISSITSQDLADMAAGYVPNSLTVDGTHPTAAFKTVLAKRIALTLKIRGI